MFHITTLPVDNLQVCMLLLGGEKYSLIIVIFKSFTLLLTYLLTYSMQKIPSSEANRSSVTQ